MNDSFEYRATNRILKNNIKARDSKEELLISFIDTYCKGDHSNLKYYSIESILRHGRTIQNEFKNYEPSKEVKKFRKKRAGGNHGCNLSRVR